ncbi:MAG: hypothetical protein CM15mP86_16660 [Gammaproteobacteria bacterium]|nr:MAG: hypothetical protein CM15mP86_16660 [Gammaproteobacteria bacterium]
MAMKATLINFKKFAQNFFLVPFQLRKFPFLNFADALGLEIFTLLNLC